MQMYRIATYREEIPIEIHAYVEEEEAALKHMDLLRNELGGVRTPYTRRMTLVEISEKDMGNTIVIRRDL